MNICSSILHMSFVQKSLFIHIAASKVFFFYIYHNFISVETLVLASKVVLTLLHSEQPKLHRVLAVLSAIG